MSDQERRDCEHGQLARQCRICELEALVAQQAQEIEQLQADRDAFHMDYRIKSDQQSKAALVRAEQAEAEIARLKAPPDQEVSIAAKLRGVRFVDIDGRNKVIELLARQAQEIQGVQSDLRKADREIQDLRTERDQREASLKRIHARFGATNADGECDCPYCRRDAEALGEMTADYELREWKASQRAESAEASRDALREALKEVLSYWHSRDVLSDADIDGVRFCPMRSTPKTKDVLRWHGTLAETPTEDPLKEV